MKVEVHDLKHDKWFLEAEPEDTIGDLKKKNSAERSLDESSNQKMIYSGKILKDTDTLSSINYGEGKGFIVCMVSKSRKPVARPQPKAEPPAEAASAAAGAEKSGHRSESPSPAAESGARAANDSDLMGPSALATGSHLNTIVANIMEMGYPQQQVIRALRQAYNNPDRAVEYLVTGQVPEVPEVPETAEAREGSREGSEAPAEGSRSTSQHPEGAEGSQAQASTEQKRGAQSSSSSIDRDLFDAAEEREMEEEEEEEVAPEEDIDFHELLGLDDEQLSELRAAVRQNPHELLRLLDPLVRNNPQVAETLINNLDQFMWFLQSSGGDATEAGDEEDMAVDSETRPVAITQEEEAAIHRLMELGFEFDIVALAYLACEKDEQLTANYLLEHGHED